MFVNQFGVELEEILRLTLTAQLLLYALQAWCFNVSMLVCSTGIVIGAPWCSRFFLGFLLAYYLLNGRCSSVYSVNTKLNQLPLCVGELEQMVKSTLLLHKTGAYSFLLKLGICHEVSAFSVEEY